MTANETSTTTPVEGHFDLTLVGSGMASSFTCIRLLEQLNEEPPPQKIRLLIIEKGGDFFGGIPYGRRSGTSALIITPLDEFLPPAELDLFQEWLAIHGASLLADMKDRGGPRTEAWMVRAEADVLNGSADKFHVPRSLWGAYLSHRLTELANIGAAEGWLDFKTLSAEVTEVKKSSDGFALTTATDAATIQTQRVVLAIGMPPTKRLFEEIDDVGALLIEDPYSPDLDSTMDRIEAHLRAEVSPHIGVIGANAGSLEMLYMLSNRPAIEGAGAHVHVLSPQGRLPERYNAKPDPAFEPTHLPAAGAHDQVTANDILKAVELDLADARSAGLGISDSLPPISAAVGSLLSRLNDDEMRAFVRHPGIEIGRLQRRAGDEYCDAADDLEADNRLDIIAGRFSGLSPSGRKTANLSYLTGDGTLECLDAPLSVVVNCAGSSGLQRPNASPLIEWLLKSDLCRPTESGHGFQVNDRFEAKPGLFVNGPLLAGNVVNGSGIWHVEHVGRIIGFAGQLAEILTEELATSSK